MNIRGAFGPALVARSSSATMVRRTVDPDEIAAALAADRFYAAYALGFLEDHSFAKSSWAIAEGPGGAGSAIGLIYRGLRPHFAFLMGPAARVRDLLAEGIRPRQAYFACRPSHLDDLRDFYRTGTTDLMIRMRVTAETFRPVEHDAVPLDSSQISTVNRLYSRGVGAILTRTLMNEGRYFGIFHQRTLVAVAGTHFIAPRYEIAAVGNVFTHPDYRGRGLAKACTSAVTASLLNDCPDVVLNVNAVNEPARRAYRRLGYEEYCPFIEVYGTRREATSLRHFISRVFGAD